MASNSRAASLDAQGLDGLNGCGAACGDDGGEGEGGDRADKDYRVALILASSQWFAQD